MKAKIIIRKQNAKFGKRWYNSVDCKDYYLESEPQKPMTLTEAIQHAKEVAASKCDECGKEHAQLAEWLQELKVQRDRVDVLTEHVKIYEAHLKKTQDSLAYYIDEYKKNEVRLASYKDKTLISADFLLRNGFEKREYDYLYCDDVAEISAQCIDAEMGIWRVSIAFLDHCGNAESLDICTVGQLRMLLAIEGLDNIAKQLK